MIKKVQISHRQTPLQGAFNGFLVFLAFFKIKFHLKITFVEDFEYWRSWDVPLLAGRRGVLVCLLHQHTQQQCTKYRILLIEFDLRWLETQVTSINLLVNRMKLEDFCHFYSDLDICCLCPDFLDGSDSCHWKTYCYEGKWVAGISAGGCLNHTSTWSTLTTLCSLQLLRKGKGRLLLLTCTVFLADSFWINLQYRIKVDKLLSGCSSSIYEKTMLVSLMQKPDKRNRRLVQNLHIGFSVFEVNLINCIIFGLHLLKQLANNNIISPF